MSASKIGDNTATAAVMTTLSAIHGVVGDEGRGVPTILEMGVHTRLDNATGSAGTMHQCVAQAIHLARHRTAFGRLLIDQPLMGNVLADLALECESATVLAMRVARAFDALQDETESALRRILTPVAKYWVCKRAPAVATEAMEVLGGNGYVEEGPIARRFRELPLNSIWEGSGNIMCLDVLRALTRDSKTRDALVLLLQTCRGADARYDEHVARLFHDLADPADSELRARRLTEGIALAVQGAILIEHGPSFVAEAFIASRIVNGAPAAFGTLPAGLDFRALIDRAHAGH